MIATTIDVLPLDLELWAAPDYHVDLDSVRDHSEQSIMNVALQTLTRRNYAVGAVIDWDGSGLGATEVARVFGHFVEFFQVRGELRDFRSDALGRGFGRRQADRGSEISRPRDRLRIWRQT